ncbi:uncharacterized protein [Epargyreus clarus]|uniref:uncharacterized protein n=1 Tax=Epargyreus clarus TaxID=520877 RepID=UPI003C2B20A8
MLKITLALTVLVAVLVTESSCQGYKIILPTYRPPPTRGPIIRTAREVHDQALSSDDLYQPSEGVTDAPKRLPRSFDSRSSKHHGGSHSTSGGSRDTGATHPGYNRRNA